MDKILFHSEVEDVQIFNLSREIKPKVRFLLTLHAVYHISDPKII